MPVACSHRPLISTRTSPETKRRFAALAASRDVTESRLLMQLICTVLDHNPVGEVVRHGGTGDRVTLRLRPGDMARVIERAASRGMRPASYMVALIRANVRGSTPFPTHELNALKAAVNQLASVSRQLQQMLHSEVMRADHEELRSILLDALHQVEAVRRETADLVRTNLLSWEASDA